jgi:Domain of unknown function (DUF4760)
VTLALVGVTFWMARVQANILREQAEILRNDLKVRLQLTFIERFDDPRMKADRSLLAQRLLARAPHDEIQEDVLNFFEDMDLFLERGYLQEDLIWSTFGFYAVRWWAACKDYVLMEQRMKNDNTLFNGFKDLVSRCSKRDVQEGLEEPTSVEIRVFLEDERKLQS